MFQKKGVGTSRGSQISLDYIMTAPPPNLTPLLHNTASSDLEEGFRRGGKTKERIERKEREDHAGASFCYHPPSNASVARLLSPSLRSWRYCVGARLKFWRRSRVPEKGRRLNFSRLRREISLDYYTIAPATQATDLTTGLRINLFFRVTSEASRLQFFACLSHVMAGYGDLVVL